MIGLPSVFWLTSALAVLIGVLGAALHVFFSVNKTVIVALIVAGCWYFGIIEERRNRSRTAETRNVDNFSFSSTLLRPLIFTDLGVLGFFGLLS
jgi:hypothetical protein